MILYHGSDVVVEHPDNTYSKNHLDFGVGFYTTTVREQAERWARRKTALKVKNKGYLKIRIYNMRSKPATFL